MTRMYFSPGTDCQPPESTVDLDYPGNTPNGMNEEGETAMPEKRQLNRNHKRLSVRYGEEQCNRIAFADNFNEEGIFLRTSNVHRPGMKLQMTLNTPDGDVVVEGQVAWARRIPPHMLRLVKNGGMGIRFTQFHSGEDLFKRFCQELRH